MHAIGSSRRARPGLSWMAQIVQLRYLGTDSAKRSSCAAQVGGLTRQQAHRPPRRRHAMSAPLRAKHWLLKKMQNPEKTPLPEVVSRVTGFFTRSNDNNFWTAP